MTNPIDKGNGNFEGIEVPQGHNVMSWIKEQRARLSEFIKDGGLSEHPGISGLKAQGMPTPIDAPIVASAAPAPDPPTPHLPTPTV